MEPGDLGYLAAFAAKALVDGDITGEEGDTFKAGELGEFDVGADANVLLGDPFTFNADNIDDFDFWSDKVRTAVSPAAAPARPHQREEPAP